MKEYSQALLRQIPAEPPGKPTPAWKDFFGQDIDDRFQ
jgi:hypothetical protein